MLSPSVPPLERLGRFAEVGIFDKNSMSAIGQLRLRPFLPWLTGTVLGKEGIDTVSLTRRRGADRIPSLTRGIVEIGKWPLNKVTSLWYSLVR